MQLGYRQWIPALVLWTVFTVAGQFATGGSLDPLPEPPCRFDSFGSLKQALANWQVNSPADQKFALDIIENGTVPYKALIRIENPTFKESNDLIYKDPVLVDAVEHWWRKLWLEEISSDPVIQKFLIRNEAQNGTQNGDRPAKAVYAEFNNIILLTSDASPEFTRAWKGVMDRVAAKYESEFGAFLNLPQHQKLKQRFEAARTLVRELQRHHNSVKVDTRFGVEPLSLAAYHNRQARKIEVVPKGTAPFIEVGQDDIARMQTQLSRFKSVLSKARTEFSGTKGILTPEGGLTTEVNAILRKIPKMNVDSYVDRVRREIQDELGFDLPDLTWRNLRNHFRDYYLSMDRSLAKQTLKDYLINRFKTIGKDTGQRVFDAADLIPADGEGLKHQFILDTMNERLPNQRITLAQAKLISELFSLADDFDRPLLNSKRILVRPDRATHNHFGFDLSEQGAYNATTVQQAMASSTNLTEALSKIKEQEAIATQVFREILDTPNVMASQRGWTQGRSDAFQASGDDASLAVDKSLSPKARQDYLKEVATRLRELGLKNHSQGKIAQPEIAYRMRVVYNRDGGNEERVASGHSYIKSAQTILMNQGQMELVRPVLFSIEVIPKANGKGTHTRWSLVRSDGQKWTTETKRIFTDAVKAAVQGDENATTTIRFW